MLDTEAPSSDGVLMGQQWIEPGPCPGGLLVQWSRCELGTCASTVLSGERSSMRASVESLVATFLVGDHGSEVLQWPGLSWHQAELFCGLGPQRMSRGKGGWEQWARRRGQLLSWRLLFLYCWYLCFRVSFQLLTSINTFTQDWSCDLRNLKFVSAVW